MGHEPKIDVRIPYEPGGKLGWDYNRIMAETPHEWVLFLDHDVLLLNPNWYHICQQATQFGGSLVTCKTNAKHSNTGQQDLGAPASDCVSEHQQRASLLWQQHGMQTTELEKASGFFMLVKKAAWSTCGGFPGVGMFREDWQFSRRVKKAGGKILCLDGLYVYHIKSRVGTWIQNAETTKEVSIRECGK